MELVNDVISRSNGNRIERVIVKVPDSGPLRGIGVEALGTQQRSSTLCGKVGQVVPRSQFVAPFATNEFHLPALALWVGSDWHGRIPSHSDHK
jgi:hypothetical protein